jgi:hypothetical protein
LCETPTPTTNVAQDVAQWQAGRAVGGSGLLPLPPPTPRQLLRALKDPYRVRFSKVSLLFIQYTLAEIFHILNFSTPICFCRWSICAVAHSILRPSALHKPTLFDAKTMRRKVKIYMRDSLSYQNRCWSNNARSAQRHQKRTIPRL